MAKTYDAILKHLVEAYPAAWLAGVGWPTAGPVRVIDADVSTVTAGADKVICVEGEPSWLMHLELQAGPDMELIDRAHLYNVVLRRRHGVPVRSALFLLRREADSPRFTGLLEQLDPAGDWERRWRYRVIRVWQLPSEALLTGGLGLLPLRAADRRRGGSLAGRDPPHRRAAHGRGAAGVRHAGNGRLLPDGLTLFTSGGGGALERSARDGRIFDVPICDRKR